MLNENNLYIIVIYIVITANYCKCMLLVYNVHWILDFKYYYYYIHVMYSGICDDIKNYYGIGLWVLSFDKRPYLDHIEIAQDRVKACSKLACPGSSTRVVCMHAAPK